MKSDDIQTECREFVDTPDGGCVALDWAPTKEGLENDATPTLVVLHGLTGGSHESYIRCLLEVVSSNVRQRDDLFADCLIM